MHGVCKYVLFCTLYSCSLPVLFYSKLWASLGLHCDQWIFHPFVSEHLQFSVFLSCVSVFQDLHEHFFLNPCVYPCLCKLFPVLLYAKGGKIFRQKGGEAVRPGNRVMCYIQLISYHPEALKAGAGVDLISSMFIELTVVTRWKVSVPGDTI